MNKIPVFLSILLFGILLCRHGSAELEQIKFAYIGTDADSAFAGAQQGLLEANLQGRFIGRQYMLQVFAPDQWRQPDLSEFIGILTAAGKDPLIAIAEAHPDTPVFNLAARDNSLRTDCHNNLLHIIPSQRMLDDAVAQWQQKQPGSSALARAWHPDFKKFAARDLNKRFLHNQGIRMDDRAWSGWAAVKMTSDAAVRGTGTRAADMLRYLKTELSFDGQKGSIMNFRVTGQLRQLVLLVENDDIVAEAPVRGVAGSAGLDSLGLLDCAK